MSQRVLVTGGHGFVGSHLLTKLLAQDYEVHTVLRETQKAWRLTPLLQHKKLHLHELDLRDRDSLTSLATKLQPNIIYHLAARGAYHWQNDPYDIFETNVVGTLNLLQATRTVPYTLLVNVGSSSEYGFSDTAMSEETALKPNSYYAVAKAAQSMLAQLEATTAQKPIVTVRLFTVYGPWEDPHKLIPTLLHKALTHQSAQLTNPDSTHDYIYIDDVVAALLKISELQRYPGEIFNLGSGTETNLKTVAELVERVTQTSLQAQWGAYETHRWDTKHWVANNQKAIKLLQWQPKDDLQSGITKTWQWFQKHHYLYEAIDRS